MFGITNKLLTFAALSNQIQIMQPTKKHYGEIEIALLPQNIEPFEADAKKIGGTFEMTYQYTNDGARSYLVQTENVADLFLISNLIRKYEKMQFNS